MLTGCSCGLEDQLDVESVQDRPVPFLKTVTMRDLANALVVGTLRNGFIQTLHTGKPSELPLDGLVFQNVRSGRG
jgi:hypothetical protein